MAYEKKVAWEDQYCIRVNPTAIGTHAAATTGVFATTHGIGSLTTNGLLLDERPSIDYGTEIATNEKTTGLSQKKTGSSAIGSELSITGHMPKLSIGSMGVTEYKMAVFGWSLFQKGVTEVATTPWAKTMIPYVAGGSDPEVFLEIGRGFGDLSVANGQHLSGCIVNSMSITGSNGERMTMGVDFLGAKIKSNYDHSASDFTAETVADHVFLDYSWTLDGNALSIQSFDCQISNNVTPVRYNSLYTTGYTLNRMSASGNIAIAMSTTTEGDLVQYDNFVAGTDMLLVGTNTAKIVFTFNIHYTGTPNIDPAEMEHLVTCPFDGVYDGTNNAAKIVVTDTVDRSIP